MEEQNAVSILTAKKLSKVILFLYGKDSLSLDDHNQLTAESIYFILKTKNSKELKQRLEERYDATANDNAGQDDNK